MFRIIAEHNHHYFDVGCFICGERFELLEPAFLLRDDEGNRQHICRDCAARDAHGLRERLRARLEELRASADELEEFLEEEFVPGQIQPYDAGDYPDTFCEGCGPVKGARKRPPTVVEEISYFGGCPECWDIDVCLNVGREHWFICHQHRTKWRGGSNVFSSWRHETEDDWTRNAEVLQGYREVEAVYPPSVLAADGVEEDLADWDLPF
jgi:hypothetical protein